MNTKKPVPAPILGAEGALFHRRAQSTYVMVSLHDRRKSYHADEFCKHLRSESRWLLSCETHRNHFAVDKVVAAKHALARPEEWCPTCKGMLNRTSEWGSPVEMRARSERKYG